MILIADCDIAAFGDFDGVGQRFGNLVSENGEHLVAIFEIELVGLHAHPPLVRHRGAGLDAEHDFMRLRVFAPEVVHVVRGDDRDSRLLCQRDQAPVDLLLLGKIVIHQLDIEVFLPEDVEIFVENLFRRLHAGIADCAVDLPGQTRARGDEAFGVRGEEGLVGPRLVVESARVGVGDDVAEIVIADIVFREQDQMVSLDVGDRAVALFAAAGSHIGFASDNRLELGFFHRVVKFEASSHDAVIGDRARLHAGVFDRGDEVKLSFGVLEFRPGDRAGAVQQAVIGMQMKMNKILGHGTPYVGAKKRPENVGGESPVS